MINVKRIKPLHADLYSRAKNAVAGFFGGVIEDARVLAQSILPVNAALLAA